MSYVEECDPPIPIGRQKFAYQCENIALEPVAGSISIHAYIPSERGKEPYPNAEKEKVQHYELKISRFTANAIEISFTKRFKDGSEDLYLTNVSFSQLVNQLFTGNPANVWKHEAPVKQFEP
jgi:hypothetical protein